MTHQFDWQTEEDIDWDALPNIPEAPRRRAPINSRRLLLALTLTAVLLLVGGWRFRRLVQEGLTAVEKDISASFNIYNRAAIAQDDELLQTVISGANSKWTFTRLEMVSEDMIFNRAPFSLYLQDAGATEVVSLTTDETLTAAELVSEHEYIYIQPDGLETEVRLRQTAVIRKGENRWLVARPERGYWGGWQTENGAFISLTYPEKDAELARRLLPDLETAVSTLCKFDSYPCPHGQTVHVRFDTDPQSLLKTADPGWMMRPQRTLNLPTPTLVGLPVDSAGYEAIMTGYAAFIISHFLLDIVDWDCCARGLFHQALLDWQLAELGLRPWPLGPEQYQHLVRDGVEGPDLERYWENTPRPLWGHAQRQVYTFTAYMLSLDHGLSPFQLQRRLQRASSYGQWAQSITGRSIFDDLLLRSWFNFIRQRMPIVPDEQATLGFYDPFPRSPDGRWLTMPSNAASASIGRLVAVGCCW
jgi:hypothetical protein